MATITAPWLPERSLPQLVSQEVERLLRNGPFKDALQRAASQDRGTWLSRQFNITHRAAHARARWLDEMIARYVQDAPRVVTIAADDWSHYMTLVYRERGPATADEVEAAARKGPSEWYFYVASELLNWPWYGESPGTEASSLSAWRKIGADNQMLWSMKDFERLRGV